jgi:hypothetical protein
VRMIGTENLWKNLITQIFLLISLKQIVQELCAVRTMQQDETRRDERDGEGNEVLMWCPKQIPGPQTRGH